MTKHLDSLKIQNFRMLEDFEVPKLGQINLIVGKNNSGKSTVLEALRIYAGNAQFYILKDIAKGHDEKYVYLEHEMHSPNTDIPFLGFFSGRMMQPQLSFFIGDAHKKIEVMYIDLEKAHTETKKKYQYLQNSNGIFFGQKNIHQLFFALNSQNNIYNINLSKSEDSIAKTHYEQLIEIPCGYIPVNLLEMKKLAHSWDEVLVAQQEEIVYEILKLINPDFKSLIFIENPHNPTGSRIPYMSINGQARRIPLKSQGYGTQRILQIALNIYQAKDGFLLIDEFENGLHYSVQEKVWGLIFEMAQRLNIQVFATTHSWDCIEAFSKVAVKRTDVEGLLFRMGRSAKTSDNGKIIATIFDEEKLERMTQADMEIR